jgi:peptide/nickel transport system substrate-binding protein
MQESYWSKTLRQRLSRRRALAATGSAAFGVALLAACGGDSSDEGGGSGLIFTPTDRTKEAKRGGKLPQGIGEETTTWDPTQSGAQLRAEINSTILRPKSAVGRAPIGEVEGDLAESWEISPDKLTMTFKIRRNAHFAPTPPTNGRVVDIEDIKASFDYYERLGNRAADLFNSKSPGAPLLSVTTPDATTLVLKLKQPDVVIQSILATSTYVVALAKEGINGQFDLRSTPHGSGPLYVKEHQPSVHTLLERNPGYHLDGPYINTWDWFYVKEYATLLTQFRGANIYLMDAQDVSIQDVLPTKRGQPELNLVKEAIVADQNQQFFGYKDGPISQFRDERVRQALSMSYDRDLWIDTFYSVGNFEKEGLPVQTRWSLGGMPANIQGRWVLDPQNKIKGQELGESSKYYEHNPAEAKKLLAAAGFPNGAQSESHHVTTADYGANAPKMIEVLLQMAQDGGFNIKVVPEAYATSYRNNYRDAKGNFEGTSFVRVSLADEEDPTNRIFAQYHKTGDLFKGFDANGQTAGAGDPALDDLVVKMRGEFDLDKRIALAHDVQKIDAKKMYYIRFPGGAESFSLAWPAIANYGIYKGGYPWWYYWMDDTKAPLKRA